MEAAKPQHRAEQASATTDMMLIGLHAALGNNAVCRCRTTVGMLTSKVPRI